MLRQAIPAALTTTALALSACGGDDDASDVRSTFNGYYRALASPHPSDACRLLTEAGKRRLIQATGTKTCEDFALNLAMLLSVDSVEGDANREGLRNVRARGVIFADRHRKAIISHDQVSVPPPLKRTDNGRPTVLVRHSGAWLIEDLGT
jgi:hypothetical protein